MSETENRDQQGHSEIAEAVARGMKAVLADALAGEQWSADSIATFQRIFDEYAAVPGMTASQIAGVLNAVGAAINQRVSPLLAQQPGRKSEPVGMAISETEDGTFFYMTLNREDGPPIAALTVLLSGTEESPTLIKLGPFVPGKSATAN